MTGRTPGCQQGSWLSSPGWRGCYSRSELQAMHAGKRALPWYTTITRVFGGWGRAGRHACGMQASHQHHILMTILPPHPHCYSHSATHRYSHSVTSTIS